MAVDALDPGPDGNYSYFPRDAEGNPVWSDGPRGSQEGGTLMPRGIQLMRDPANPGRLVVVDVTPRLADGTVIDPPVIPPNGPDAA